MTLILQQLAAFTEILELIGANEKCMKVPFVLCFSQLSFHFPGIPVLIHVLIEHVLDIIFTQSKNLEKKHFLSKVTVFSLIFLFLHFEFSPIH